jgi:hypothetical protein
MKQGLLEVEVVNALDRSPLPEVVIDGKTYIEAVDGTSYMVKIKPIATAFDPAIDVFRVDLYIDGVLFLCIGYTPKSKNISTGEYDYATFQGFIKDEKQ